jgi:hypothetical protein
MEVQTIVTPNRPDSGITVTDAGRENLVLRALVRQAIPILRAPEGASRAERLQLARTLACALRGDTGPAGDLQPPDPTDADAPFFDGDGPEYEPGAWL